MRKYLKDEKCRREMWEHRYQTLCRARRLREAFSAKMLRECVISTLDILAKHFLGQLTTCGPIRSKNA